MLDIRNVSKDLGEFILNDVSLEVRKGEYMIIIGPTGAGKTIMLETIAGIYPPDDGQIILEGTDITQMPPKERKFSICCWRLRAGKKPRRKFWGPMNFSVLQGLE